MAETPLHPLAEEVTAGAAPAPRARSWGMHWSRGPAVIARRFCDLGPPDVVSLLAAHGLSVRGAPASLPSVENRVVLCEVGAGERVVVKLYRPGRWSAEALAEERVFLHELEDEGVPVVRPRPLPGGGELGTWKGISFGLFQAERVTPPPPGPFDEEALVALGRLIARVHSVGKRRPATHRMTIGARTMGLGNLRVIERGGLLPADLLPEYCALVREITARSTPLLAGLPLHRLHGDFGVHNLLWTDRGVVVADLDDFMVGPAAFDLCRVYMGITTPWGDPELDEAARDRATQAVVAGYREVLPLPEVCVRPIEALRVLRMVWSDAWKRSRLHDPHFRDTRRGLRERGFWLARLAFLRGQAEKLRRGG